MKRLVVLLIAIAGPAFAVDTTVPPKAKAAASTKPAVRLEVTVTSDGFTVKDPRVLKVGQPVTLVVSRTTERTCATEIVLKEFGISTPLPMNKPVEVTFVPKKAGLVHFACSMDMVSGDLKVE
jgi:plastocyanin domain-containing protein